MKQPKLLAARARADGLQGRTPKVSASTQPPPPSKAANTAVIAIKNTFNSIQAPSIAISSHFRLGMAPSRRLKNLVCFYCNGKSAQKQDGTIRQWDCKRCDATNYLDENGEITDPPTSTTDNAFNTSFAQPIEPPEWSTASIPDSAFCQKCIKNQHLYRSSLAQYLPGESHPEYKKLLNNLDNFKTELESRYPQVCENCVERVQLKMKRALYGAKADAHGRLLERTRRNGGPGARPRTWLEFFHAAGGTAWAWGIYLQIACLVVLLMHGISQTALSSADEDISLESAPNSWLTQSVQSLGDIGSDFLVSIPDTFMITVPVATKTSLALSIGSIWWNPQWRFTRKQNLHTVFGLHDWYWQQAILLLLRLAAWRGQNSLIPSNAGAPTRLALYAFILAFTMWTSVYSTRKVTMKPRKLFASAPDRDALLPKRKNNANVGKPRPPNTLLDALESLDEEPTIPSSPITPTETINYASPETEHRASNFLNLEDSPTKPHNLRSGTRPPPTSKSLFGANSQSSHQHTFHSVAPLLTDSSGPGGGPDPDAMEWTPTTSQHRAFNSGLSAQRTTQSFNQAPVSERSVFWYKVPQAPMGPARRLRNPPVQPLLATTSVERKENFFNRTSGRDGGRDGNGDGFQVFGRKGGEGKESREYAFQQPRFFPPGASEDDTGLVDLLGRAFNISDSETDEGPNTPRTKKSRRKSAAKAKMTGWRSWLGM